MKRININAIQQICEEEKEIQSDINKELYDNLNEDKEDDEQYEIKDYLYTDKISDNELGYKMFGCIFCMQDFYNSNMDNEEDWSKYGPTIKKIREKKEKNTETEIRNNLALYIKRIILYIYPNNIIEEDIIKQITPKMIKGLIYCGNGLEFLGKVGNTYDYVENNDKKEQNTYPITHYIEERKLLELGLEKTEIDEIIAQGVTKREKNSIIENEIINDFLRLYLDKIIIASLRHNKTDYDKCDFEYEEDNEYYNRVDRRRYYNSFCRDKYLYNAYDIEEEEDKEGNTRHVTDVYNYNIEDIERFGEKTATGEFSFFFNEEENEEENEKEEIEEAKKKINV